MIFNKILVFMVFYPVEFFVLTIALSLMFFAVILYIEKRPTRVKLDKSPWRYPTSIDSFTAHIPTPILVKYNDVTESIEVRHR